MTASQCSPCGRSARRTYAADITMLNTRIHGIPCLIDVQHVYCQPALGPMADSDDAWGYREVEFQVCDRRGRPAPWLERKLTAAERQQIETLICKPRPADDY